MPKSKSKLHPKMKAVQWKKGQTGNPNGRPPISPAQRALKNLTVETYREVIELVLTGNVADLKAMAENPNTPAIQVGVAVSFMKAIKSGDYAIIERIAERIVGKIPDVVHVNSNNNTNMNISAVDRVKLKAAMDAIEKDV